MGLSDTLRNRWRMKKREERCTMTMRGTMSPVGSSAVIHLYS